MTSRVFDGGVLVSETEDPADAAWLAGQRNRAALLAKAQPAIVANLAYLSNPEPTTADRFAQLDLLTREMTAVLRLLANVLDDISGT